MERHYDWFRDRLATFWRKCPVRGVEKWRARLLPSGKVKRLVWSLALLLICIACRNTIPSNHLKIGTLLPITGDLSSYGSSMQDAASLLIKTVNGCGGVLGQPVELFAEDDQTQPVAGTSAITKLAEVDRVGGIVGAASSAVASATVGVAVRNQVVLISPSSTSPVFTERARKGDFKGFWFRTAPPDTFQGKALAKLAKLRGFKAVSILVINNDYGNGLVTSFTPAFEALGGKVVNSVPFPPDSSTFDSVVGTVFQNTPDAVLLIAYPETGSLILKAAYEQGYLGKKTQLLTTDGMKEAKIAELVGKNTKQEYIAAGMVGVAASAGGPAIQAFQEQYQKQYGRSPKIYDPNTWDATALLVLAAEAAKSPAGMVMKDALRAIANPPGESVTDVCQALSLIRAGKEINYEGASGSVDLDAQGDVTGSYDVWMIASDGSLKVLEAIAVTESQK